MSVQEFHMMSPLLTLMEKISDDKSRDDSNGNIVPIMHVKYV